MVRVNEMGGKRRRRRREKKEPSRTEPRVFSSSSDVVCVCAVLGDGRLLRVLLCIECKMCREGEGEEEEEKLKES